MPLFVLIGHDGPDGAERRDANRDAHVDFWRSLDGQGKVKLAGPIRTPDDSASTGAVIVFEAEDLDAAQALVAQDAYVSGGVYDALTVARFRHVFPASQ